MKSFSPLCAINLVLRQLEHTVKKALTWIVCDVEKRRLLRRAVSFWQIYLKTIHDFIVSNDWWRMGWVYWVQFYPGRVKGMFVIDSAQTSEEFDIDEPIEVNKMPMVVKGGRSRLQKCRSDWFWQHRKKMKSTGIIKTKII